MHALRFYFYLPEKATSKNHCLSVLFVVITNHTFPRSCILCISIFMLNNIRDAKGASELFKQNLYLNLYAIIVILLF